MCFINELGGFMKFLVILSFLFTTYSMFAKAANMNKTCPEMQGYIVMDGASSMAYYHWTGEQGFTITDYNLVGVQNEDFQKNKESFFLRFKKGTFESQLYSVQDCSVKGSINITGVSQIGAKEIYLLNP